jgi:hypothetical protein
LPRSGFVFEAKRSSSVFLLALLQTPPVQIDGVFCVFCFLLDLDTGFRERIVGQQLTPTDAVVSITRGGSRRGDQAALGSRTLGGKAMRAALNSGPMTPVAGVRRVICRPSLVIVIS